MVKKKHVKTLNTIVSIRIFPYINQSIDQQVQLRSTSSAGTTSSAIRPVAPAPEKAGQLSAHLAWPEKSVLSGQKLGSRHVDMSENKVHYTVYLKIQWWFVSLSHKLKITILD